MANAVENELSNIPGTISLTISIIIKQNKVKKEYLNIKDRLEMYTIKFEATLEELLSSYGVEICN